MSIEEKTVFARRLRALRREHGLLQKEIASAIGIPSSRYANWEEGRTMPPPTFLPRIAEAYRITLNELMEVKPQGIDEILYRKVKAMPEDTKEALLEFIDVFSKNVTSRMASERR